MKAPFSLSREKVCRDQQELMNSKAVARVLSLYNRENNTEIELADLQNDYTLALQVSEFFDQLEVRGNLKSMARINKLRNRVLRDIRSVDTQRVVPADELSERLRKISRLPDLQQSVNNWTVFYNKSGLATREESPMPTVREGALGNFEKLSHRTGLRPDLFFIDKGGRQSDLETVNHFFPGSQRNVEKLRSMLIESRTLNPAQLEKLVADCRLVESEEQILELFQQAYQEAGEEEVGGHLQLLACRLDPETDRNMATHPAQSFLDTLAEFSPRAMTHFIGKNAVSIPTVGQYLRLSRYLKQMSPEDHYRFHNRELEYQEILLCTPVNHVLPNGKILSLRGDLAGDIRVFAVHPKERIPNQKARPLYLGDAIEPKAD